MNHTWPRKADLFEGWAISFSISAKTAQHSKTCRTFLTQTFRFAIFTCLCLCGCHCVCQKIVNRILIHLIQGLGSGGRPNEQKMPEWSGCVLLTLLQMLFYSNRRRPPVASVNIDLDTSQRNSAPAANRRFHYVLPSPEINHNVLMRRRLREIRTFST